MPQHSSQNFETAYFRRTCDDQMSPLCIKLLFNGDPISIEYEPFVRETTDLIWLLSLASKAQANMNKANEIFYYFSTI